MIIGCLPSLGSSIRSLANTGQHGRLLDYYFPAYLRRFERIFFFSYADESITDYTYKPGVVDHLNLVPNRGLMGRKWYALTLAFQQAQHLRQCNVLRVYQATGVLPAIVAQRLYGVPFVTTYGYRYADLAKQLGTASWKVAVYRWLEWSALRFADGIIITTDELENHVRQYSPVDKIHYIPNGVDTTTFKPLEIEPGDRETMTIVFVGRFERQKDLPTLLKAAALLNGHRGEVLQLKFVGDGTLREELALQSQSLGLRLDLLGTVPHHRLPELLNSADVFVLPSLLEGHPKSLIEAMSCGLPCVVSDCDGNRTLVNDGETGFIFPVGNASQLAAQLRRVFTQPELARQLGWNARRSIVQRFSLNTLLEKETDLLADLASRRGLGTR